MNLEEKYTLIETYLAGELQGEELNAFEEKLAVDSSLQDELNLHREVSETLKGEKVHHLRNVLKEVDQNWEGDAKKKSGKVFPFNFRRMISIAAAVAMLFVAYQWFSNNNTSPQDLYAAHFEPYPMVLNQRSIDESTADNDALYNNMISFYAKKQNKEALNAFEQLIEKQPDNISFLFYKANILLAENKTTEPIAIFQKIIAQGNPLFIEQARWYLAMAYLQSNKKELAKAELAKIEKGQFKWKEASEIVSKN